nr:hypothetical protein [Angustibacter aerolatus]
MATQPQHDAATAAPSRSGKVKAGPAGRSGIAPWLFLAPYLVLFLAFVVAPIVFGLWISLHDYDYTLPGKPFVGLDNYAKALHRGVGHRRAVLAGHAGDRHLHGDQRAAAARRPARGRAADEREGSGAATCSARCTSRRTCWASPSSPRCGGSCSTRTSAW